MEGMFSFFYVFLFFFVCFEVWCLVWEMYDYVLCVFLWVCLVVSVCDVKFYC